MRKVTVAAAGCWMILVIACGCHSGSTGKILSRDTMRTVLMEMLRADAYNDFLSIKDTNYRHDTAYALLYANIWGSHHISREQFSDSYTYYMSRPMELKGLIDSMANEANREFAKEKPVPSKGFVPPVHGSGIGHPAWQNHPPGRPMALPGRPMTPGGNPPRPTPLKPATPRPATPRPAAAKPAPAGYAPAGPVTH